jgi:hypothetical protein
VNQTICLTLRSAQSSAEPRPADGLHGAICRHERKCVVAKIRAESRQLLRPVDRLEPENASGEIRCPAEIIGDEADVTQLLERDHFKLHAPQGLSYRTT